MRNDLKCPNTSVISRSRFSLIGEIFCLLIVMIFILSAAHAQGTGELGDSIRNLTRPVMESVRTTIRPTLNVTPDKAETEPTKETQTSDSSKKGDSSDSNGIEPPSIQ